LPESDRFRILRAQGQLDYKNTELFDEQLEELSSLLAVLIGVRRTPPIVVYVTGFRDGTRGIRHHAVAPQLIVMSMAAQGGVTLAHEIGHYLLGSAHHVDPENLMHSDATGQTMLDGNQVDRMRLSPYLK
jgi:hypothetical protein